MLLRRDMNAKHLVIMLTDIKGFTSKTSVSSRKETMDLLKKHKELVMPVIEQHKGHLVKTIGDAFLVTFESPTEAVICGVKIQDVLREYNKDKSASDKIEIRIAINSGEVTISDDGDIFGDAVNITSRLESIAEPGEVFFTEAVYLAMNKKEVPSSEIGYRQFKGIPEKIKVYKVLSETPIGESSIKEVDENEVNEVSKSSFVYKTPGFWIRFFALFLDFIIFSILISVLGLKSCNHNSNYDDNSETLNNIKDANVELSKKGILVKGENGEIVSISKNGVLIKDKNGNLISRSITRNNRNNFSVNKGEKGSFAILLWVLYCAVMVWRFGATPGKMIFKIKVVDYLTNEKPKIDKAFLRAFFSVISFIILGIGYLWALRSEKRTWHDIISGTKVIYTE
jgi:class 3 adenylate cyclase